MCFFEPETESGGERGHSKEQREQRLIRSERKKREAEGRVLGGGLWNYDEWNEEGEIKKGGEGEQAGQG